jgi:Fe-S cluster biogenesis protein NfuA
MFIQTEPTPNPATLKFLPGRMVLATGSANFAAREAAARSPLATRLFEVEGVTGVFLGHDFITITKAEGGDWYALKPQILGVIMEFLSSGQSAVIEEAGSPIEATDDDEIVVQIKELLETRVRPAVAQDGGDIVYHGYEDGVVSVHLQGSCAGCPSSTATLKMGIENMLKHYIPEIRAVRAV